MVVPELACWKFWIATWSYAAWKVEPEPLSVPETFAAVVAGAAAVVADPAGAAVVVDDELELLEQAPASIAARTAGMPTRSKREDRNMGSVSTPLSCRMPAWCTERTKRPSGTANLRSGPVHAMDVR